LSPFASALLAYILLSEKMSMKKWLGLLVGFLGFIPILLNETTAEELSGQFFVFSWAELAVMAAAIFGVYGWILLKQLVKEEGYTPFMANGISMTIGGVMALVNSYFVEQWDPVPVTEFRPFLECTLALILVSNLICYNLYGYLLKRYSATFISFAGFITPMFSALFGWLYLGQVVTWPFWVSASIVFLGLLIFYQEELRQDIYSTEASMG
jgi:drug/metabolite transporter (DMT)-like permease